ncbi:MAG TPA: hypothetical protein VNC50_16935 [Planctomycetia bacterium]|nr:hypothetical protein [Planctomycetia bacterium]
MAIRPVLQALVLADHIYVDAKSGKKIIAGTFNHLAAPSFPSVFGRTTFAFISLTEVHGTVPITLRYVDLQNGETLLELRNLEMEAPNDPLATVEMVVEIPRFPMPHEGAFAFEVYSNEEPIGSLRIYVTPAEEESETEEAEGTEGS